MDTSVRTVQDNLQRMSDQMRRLQLQVSDLIVRSTIPGPQTPSSSKAGDDLDKLPMDRDALREEIQHRFVEWTASKQWQAAVSSSVHAVCNSSVMAALEERIYKLHVEPKLNGWLQDVEQQLVHRVSRRVLSELNFSVRSLLIFEINCWFIVAAFFDQRFGQGVD
jgi:hypothetical protein